LFFQTLTASVQGQEMCIRELTGCSTWSRSLHPQQIIDEWAEAGGVLQPVLTYISKQLTASPDLTLQSSWQRLLDEASIASKWCQSSVPNVN
jgi:hypothetical protein